MWDFLRKQMIGFTANEVEGYIENYGFTVCKKRKEVYMPLINMDFMKYF